MLEPAKYIRCAEDSPKRCQATVGSGQCPYESMENMTVCPMHGHNIHMKKLKQESLRHYNAAKWRAQIGEFADSANLKSLREEIGVLRLLLSQKLETCMTANDLMLQSSSISELVFKISRVVADCHKLDSSLGVMLDKVQLEIFGQKMIEIIAQNIVEPELIQKIANQLVDEIKMAGNPNSRLAAELGTNKN